MIKVKMRYLAVLAVMLLALMLLLSTVMGCNIRGNIIDTGQEEKSDEAADEADGENGGIDFDKLLEELQEEQEQLPGGVALGGAYPEIDGLHVTGNPVTVNINSYRLEIKGAVDNPLSLTFDQVKDMESTRRFIVLDCPGFFTDEGYWTGVEVRKLLGSAGLKPDAAEARFISLDGGYSRSIPIEEIFSNEGIIVAYHFNDMEFPEIHGYPLRLAAEGEPGYVWVKWLGEIEVLTQDQLEEGDEKM